MISMDICGKGPRGEALQKLLDSIDGYTNPGRVEGDDEDTWEWAAELGTPPKEQGGWAINVILMRDVTAESAREYYAIPSAAEKQKESEGRLASRGAYL